MLTVTTQDLLASQPNYEHNLLHGKHKYVYQEEVIQKTIPKSIKMVSKNIIKSIQ